jgi:hypothetical protein
MRRTFRRGLSLVEVLVSASIFAGTVISATTMFSGAAFLRDRSGNYSNAAAILQRKLEQVRRLPYSKMNYTGLLSAGIIDAGSSPYSFTVVDNLPAQLSDGEGRITLSTSGTETARADITLAWSGLRGTHQQVTAVTFVSNKELWVKP